MKSISKLVCAAGAGVAATVLFAVPADAAATHHRSGHRQAPVFVQNDATSGNTIIAYDRTASGALTEVGAYPTGGKGGQLSGSVVDHLASEGSLAYDPRSRLLYAVNAGSDTITTFAVHGDELTRRQVLPSEGQFPVSIAARGRRVFVLNARDGGSISGYWQLGGHLFPIRSWHRDLHLNTSAPGQPNEFTSTPGQIGFTPDGSQILVSTKNGGNTVESFALNRFGPAAQPVVTSLPGTVPFGFDFDARGHLVLTEAAPNAVATFAVDRDGTLTALDSAATGQAATCWVVTSGRTEYASNAGSGSVSLYRSSGLGALSSEGTAVTDAGTVDAAASSDGRYLYVQAGATGVVDAYRIHADGSLVETGAVTVPNAAGAEGIVAL